MKKQEKLNSSNAPLNIDFIERNEKTELLEILNDEEMLLLIGKAGAGKTTVTASMSHSETNYTGITTTGNHAFTVLLHYELNGVAQTDITNTVNVNVTAATDSVLFSVSTPSDVQTGKGPYAFDLTCAVAENDGALVSLVAECDGNTIGTLSSVVDGNNTLSCTVPEEAAAIQAAERGQ